MKLFLISTCIILLCLHCTTVSSTPSFLEAFFAAIRAGQRYHANLTTTTKPITTTTVTTTTTLEPASEVDVMKMEAVMKMSVVAKINLASKCKKFCKRRKTGELRIRKCQGRRNTKLCLLCRITLECFREGITIF